MLPGSAAEALKMQLGRVKGLHLQDLAAGFGRVRFALCPGAKTPAHCTEVIRKPGKMTRRELSSFEERSGGIRLFPRFWF